MHNSIRVVLTVLPLLSPALSCAEKAPRNIFPQISSHLNDMEKKGNLAGASALIARIVIWNGIENISPENPPHLTAGSLNQWKDGRYGITGLSQEELDECLKGKKHKSVDARQPDINAQLSCYSIVTSTCFSMRAVDWASLSRILGIYPEEAVARWAVSFVRAYNECTRCPCPQPPPPQHLTVTPPEVEAEILCIGTSCRPQERN